MRFNDLVKIRFGQASVPYRFRINHHIWAVFALIEAPGFVGAYSCFQSTDGKFLLKHSLHLRLPFGITAAARVAEFALVGAYKNVFFKLGHTTIIEFGKTVLMEAQVEHPSLHYFFVYRY